jgi:hypothetical protein
VVVLRHVSGNVVVLRSLSDSRATQAVRDLKLNVLLDLNGYTRGERPALVNAAGGLAPIQAQFFGYEGTYGSRHAFAYILTDSAAASADYAGPLPPAKSRDLARGEGADGGGGGGGLYAEKLLLMPPSKFPSGDLVSREEEQAWLLPHHNPTRRALREEFEREVYQQPLKALLRLYSGSIKTILRLCQSSIKAL